MPYGQRPHNEEAQQLPIPFSYLALQQQQQDTQQFQPEQLPLPYMPAMDFKFPSHPPLPNMPNMHNFSDEPKAELNLSATLSQAAFKSNSHFIPPQQGSFHPTFINFNEPHSLPTILPSMAGTPPSHAESSSLLSSLSNTLSPTNALCNMWSAAFPTSTTPAPSHQTLSPATSSPFPSPTPISMLLPPLVRRQSMPYQLPQNVTSHLANDLLTSPRMRMQRLKSVSTPELRGPNGAPILDTRPRDFQCSVCSNRFLRRQDLSRHEVTHTRSREYICANGCGACFGRSDALARHMKRCGAA